MVMRDGPNRTAGGKEASNVSQRRQWRRRQRQPSLAGRGLAGWLAGWPQGGWSWPPSWEWDTLPHLPPRKELPLARFGRAASSSHRRHLKSTALSALRFAKSIYVSVLQRVVIAQAWRGDIFGTGGDGKILINLNIM